MLAALTCAVSAAGLQAQPAAQGWRLLPDSPASPGRFEDGSFPDAQNGWVVRGDGAVFRTRDGGETWAQTAMLEEEGEPLFIRSVSFVDASHGFAGALFAEETVLLETLDGGDTWEDITGRIAGAQPEGICGIWVVSPSMIVAAGWFDGAPTFVKTADGGQSWTGGSLGEHASGLVDVFFWDEQRGLIAAAVDDPDSEFGDVLPRLLLTEDGGETWSVRHTGLTYGQAWKISFPTPTTGYVSGGDSFPVLVMKTTDAGSTWTDLTSADALGGDPLQGVGFATEALGWASGRGTAYETQNGGETWSEVSLDGRINRFRFLGDSLGYAMGSRIYKYDARPTAAEAHPETRRITVHPPAPNPSSGGLSVAVDMPRAGHVVMRVYDVLGRQVAVAQDGALGAGLSTVAWDGRGARGDALSPGFYVLRLQAMGEVHTQQVSLVR